MPIAIDREIYERLSEVSPGRRELIRRAFGLLPTLARPRVLDVGCGRGGPTVEIARLGGGEVVGLDMDERSLETLVERATREGLSGRIRAVRGSMSQMDFPEGSFDVIWAEASIHAMGFEAGLEAWCRFLAARGCLVVHEMAWLAPEPPPELVEYWSGVQRGIRSVPEYLEFARRSHYEMLDHFTVPGEFWWADYYLPLESLIHELRKRHGADRVVLAALDRHQREVDIHRVHGRWVGSVYIAMRKSTPERLAAGGAPG